MARLDRYPIVVDRCDMIHVEPTLPRMTLVSTNVDRLYGSSSTTRAVVIEFADCGNLPLVSAPYTVDSSHRVDNSKRAPLPRPLASRV